MDLVAFVTALALSIVFAAGGYKESPNLGNHPYTKRVGTSSYGSTLSLTDLTAACNALSGFILGASLQIIRYSRRTGS